MKNISKKLEQIANWFFYTIGLFFCLFGRHAFKAVDIEWNWVILECVTCKKTTTHKLP